MKWYDMVCSYKAHHIDDSNPKRESKKIFNHIKNNNKTG